MKEVCSIIILLGFYGLSYLYLKGDVHVSEANAQTVGGLLIAATNFATGVAGFWFGSSYGSNQKDKTIASMTTNRELPK